MKKALLLVCMLPFFAQAQVTKGSKFLGGGISYSMLDYENSEQPFHYLNFDLYAGKFISNSVAMGPIVSVESQWTQTINPITNLFEKRNSNSFLAGLFVRKYFELSEKFFFALEGSIAAGQGKNTFPEESIFNYKVAATPMFIFQPVPKWAFLARIGELSLQNRTDAVNLTLLQANLGQLSFGVNYFLNQEKSRK
ncbi:hypothetical protein [Algoriphagus litoralis]|uniref:hypothetical protein n=1 Tax=Algoriphagus litoralis TaxID=2202829 RepID=UPI001300AAFB|nr:hypothetical protein [Algoriphagus litoralis]